MKILRPISTTLVEHPAKHALAYFVITVFIVIILALMIGLPNLRLIGASQDSNGDTVALIEDIDTKDQDVFDVGQSPYGKGTIIDIQNDKVVIENSDGSISILQQKNNISSDDNDPSSGDSTINDNYLQFFDYFHPQESPEPEDTLPAEAVEDTEMRDE